MLPDLSTLSKSKANESAEKWLKELRKLALDQLPTLTTSYSHDIHSEAAVIVENARRSLDKNIMNLASKDNGKFKSFALHGGDNKFVNNCTQLYRRKILKIMDEQRVKLENYIDTNLESHLFEAEQAAQNVSNIWYDIADVHYDFNRCKNDSCYDKVKDRAMYLKKDISSGEGEKLVKIVKLEKFKDAIQDYSVTSFFNVYNSAKSVWGNMSRCMELIAVWNRLMGQFDDVRKELENGFSQEIDGNYG